MTNIQRWKYAISSSFLQRQNFSKYLTLKVCHIFNVFPTLTCWHIFNIEKITLLQCYFNVEKWQIYCYIFIIPSTLKLQHVFNVEIVLYFQRYFSVKNVDKFPTFINNKPSTLFQRWNIVKYSTLTVYVIISIAFQCWWNVGILTLKFQRGNNIELWLFNVATNIQSIFNVDTTLRTCWVIND